MKEEEYIINEDPKNCIVPETIRTEVVFKRPKTGKFGIIMMTDRHGQSYPFIMSLGQVDIMIEALEVLKRDLKTS